MSDDSDVDTLFIKVGPLHHPPLADTRRGGAHRSGSDKPRAGAANSRKNGYRGAAVHISSPQKVGSRQKPIPAATTAAAAASKHKPGSARVGGGAQPPTAGVSSSGKNRRQHFKKSASCPLLSAGITVSARLPAAAASKKQDVASRRHLAVTGTAQLSGQSCVTFNTTSNTPSGKRGKGSGNGKSSGSNTKSAKGNSKVDRNAKRDKKRHSSKPAASTSRSKGGGKSRQQAATAAANCVQAEESRWSRHRPQCIEQDPGASLGCVTSDLSSSSTTSTSSSCDVRCVGTAAHVYRVPDVSTIGTWVTPPDTACHHFGGEDSTSVWEDDSFGCEDSDGGEGSACGEDADSAVMTPTAVYPYSDAVSATVSRIIDIDELLAAMATSGSQDELLAWRARMSHHRQAVSLGDVKLIERLLELARLRHDCAIAEERVQRERAAAAAAAAAASNNRQQAWIEKPAYGLGDGQGGESGGVPAVRQRLSTLSIQLDCKKSLVHGGGGTNKLLRRPSPVTSAAVAGKTAAAAGLFARVAWRNF